MLRIGIPVIGSQGWQGGVVYVHNVLRALRDTHAGDYQAFLITDDATINWFPEHQEIAREGLLAGLIHVGHSQVSGSATFPCTVIPHWEGLPALVDVIYPGGWAPTFDDRVVCWIPDFQYRHLPHLSPQSELDSRHEHDRRIALRARHIVFSSQDAHRDFRTAFPDSRANVSVLHFHSTIPARVFEADAAAVAARYGCGPDYLICSNQFWTHKNHRVLFRAMRSLWSRGIKLPLICTGSASDYRNSEYYGELQAELAPWNTQAQIRFLGLIPRDDQVQLLRQARAVIQPSLFEGWSTIVEDARALGAPLFASDIAVHREQAPPLVRYFPRHDATALADLIETQLPTLPPPGPERESAGRQHTAQLVREFGHKLWEVLSSVVAERTITTASRPEARPAARPLIATSIAPKNLPRQKAAVASWIAQGFDVISINCAEEIQQLTAEFPEVGFRRSTRDARALAGKPLVPLDDVLAALRAEDRPISGIVNSDIVLKPPRSGPLSAELQALGEDGFAFAKRMDQKTEEAPGARYDGGIDVFFFSRKVLFAFPPTPYYLGLPWWDYYFAAFPILAKFPTFELSEPIAFHLSHPSFYDIFKHWMPLGISTFDLLSPLFPDNAQLVNASGMEVATAAIQHLSSAAAAADAQRGMVQAFTQFAEATVQLIETGARPWGAGPPARPALDRPAATALRPTGPDRLRIGIPLIADDSWMGGVQLVVNLVRALSRLPPEEKPLLSLVIRPNYAGAVKQHVHLFPLVDQIIQIGTPAAGSTHPKLLVVRDQEELFRHIDVLYPAHLMAVPGKPVAAWIPDFQHHRLPTLFAPEEIQSRNRSFSAIAENAELLVLSSHAARRDWRKFYPNARPIVRVLPFRAAPEPGWFQLDPAAVAAKYDIHEPFLICSNQFWIHKGHSTLVDALGRLAERGIKPLVVCTGNTTDYRATAYFELLRHKIVSAGITDRFRILGLVSREEQMALMRRSLAVVQPSYFEGWSTVVEDARLMGKPMVLSEIDVHVEQRPPRSRYFTPGDADDLARVLSEVLPTLVPGPVLADEQQAQHDADALLLRYARGVCALALEARALCAPARQAPAA